MSGPPPLWPKRITVVMPGLTAREIDRLLHVQRRDFPPNRCLVVLEPGIETKRKEAARGQFPAANMVQVIRRTMGDQKCHMWRRPAVGFVERGAQLPEPDIFRMALRERRAGNR